MDQQEAQWADDLEVEHVGRMGAVQLTKIRARVQALQAEIAELGAANEKYLSKHPHLPMEIHAQRQRELRLQQIVEDLALLTKRKID